jgi:hypothetical protein
MLKKGALKQLLGAFPVWDFLGAWDFARKARVSNLTQQREDQNDQQNQTDSAKRVIAPTRAVTPAWKSADQKQDKDNQENSAHAARIGRRRRG